MSQSDAEELSYWICGLVAAALGLRLWTTKIKPWVNEHVTTLREGGEVALGPISLATSDLVAAAVIAVMCALVVGTVRSSRRSRKKAKAGEGQPSS